MLEMIGTAIGRDVEDNSVERVERQPGHHCRDYKKVTVAAYNSTAGLLVIWIAIYVTVKYVSFLKR
ncbi:hypothetical protein PHMEG_00029329 [Phytophthora megakarya]|uniref:Uncharacterized protein n=1 Tax=Phytophthora megakarya TaxID=4795 RepID=A0A225V2B9_9STRA|nr:hypothetical protein PHMEG_00029329 [Phytophthora megakarya]